MIPGFFVSLPRNDGKEPVAIEIGKIVSYTRLGEFLVRVHLLDRHTEDVACSMEQLEIAINRTVQLQMEALRRVFAGG